jgi:hypothetical protein
MDINIFIKKYFLYYFFYKKKIKKSVHVLEYSIISISKKIYKDIISIVLYTWKME